MPERDISLVHKEWKHIDLRSGVVSPWNLPVPTCASRLHEPELALTYLEGSLGFVCDPSRQRYGIAKSGNPSNAVPLVLPLAHVLVLIPLDWAR